MMDSEEALNPRGHHVVIVGAGIAGLMAARELLRCGAGNNVRVTLVEASDYVGGRIQADLTLVEGHVLDVGAEVIHGQGTLLTDLIERQAPEWQAKIGDRETLVEDIFLTAQADGGPSKAPTPDGKYGMYYLGKEMLRYDDPRLNPLHDMLENMADAPDCSTDSSIGAYLQHQISNPLYSLAVAGYGNTAGCTDLHKLSLSTLVEFEHYWEEEEEEGDVRINSRFGMQGVVAALMEELRAYNVTIELNWQVARIQQQDGGRVEVFAKAERELQADAVVVTVPPTVLSDLRFDPPLPHEKVQALEYIGMDRAIKLFLKFSVRVWPENLQSVVCAESPIPEISFREFASAETVEAETNEETAEEDCYVAVCFLTSGLADKFRTEILSHNVPLERATEIATQQMSDMFKISPTILSSAHVESRIYDWMEYPTIRGGYMYPKVGLTMQHLNVLAEPYGKVIFAGEATNTSACCTVQAAMETGVRAAGEARAILFGGRCSKQ